MTEVQRPEEGAHGTSKLPDGGSSVVILSTQHVRDLNTSRILQTLREHGPLSRAQLAAISGVRRGTIGAITKRLIEVNILEEQSSKSDHRSGRPATPLWFGSRAALTGAIAVRGDEVEVAVVNARGDVLAGDRIGLRPDDDAATIDRLIVTLFQRTAGAYTNEIVKVGVSVPGVSDHRTGEVTACHQLPGLVGTHLVEAFKNELGVDAVVDDDSLGSALGEQWFGAGRGHESFVTLQTGFGIGAGIVLDGAIIRGPAGLSTEVGHTCIDRFGAVCACGLRGCWETVASLTWVRQVAAEMELEGSASLTIARLSELAGEGDPKATELLDRYAENISIGLANLAQTLCVRRFILQGVVIQGGEALRTRIEVHTRARVLDSRRADVTIELSKMDDRADVLGAAAIALTTALPVRA
jgi:predicted NBD/HSP70 family sugar kinase